MQENHNHSAGMILGIIVAIIVIVAILVKFGPRTERFTPTDQIRDEAIQTPEPLPVYNCNPETEKCA